MDEPEIKEVWVNLDYSRSMNASSPDLNPAAPGQPYFTDVESALPGQWVRLVMGLGHGGTFRCVGALSEIVDATVVRCESVRYENGDFAPGWFAESSWRARLSLKGDGNWYADELEEEENA